MSIPNKQIFVTGDSVTNTSLNTFQDNFTSWIANHHHVNSKIPVLTITSDTRLDEIISDNDFLYNFTNRIINSALDIEDYDPDYIVLNLVSLSELYNKSILLGKENTVIKNLIYSYSSSYKIDTDGNYNFIFKNPTLSADVSNNILITVPAITGTGGFTFESAYYYQKAQTIQINKNIISDFAYNATTKVLTLDIELLENVFTGIPSLPISAHSIVDAANVSAATHIADTSKHYSTFATEAGLMETAKQYKFACPNWSIEHPLYTDGKYLVSSNDMTLALNIIKNETNSNLATQRRTEDNPLDAMFRGNSQKLSWLKTEYYSTETRRDASILSGEIDDAYNYELTASETFHAAQSFKVTDLIPRKQVTGSASTYYNKFSSEDRVSRVIRNSNTTVQEGNSLHQLPVTFRLAPNTHVKSYFYTFYYGKLARDLGESYLGNYRGSSLYYSHRTAFEYNISKNLYLEKIILLGSPYEPFNYGAEHIYTKKIKKDFSNPNASFEGYYIDEENLAQIKQYETRYV
jgi:hypothetical protein